MISATLALRARSLTACVLLAIAVPVFAQLTNAAADRLAVMNIEPTAAALVQFAAAGDAATVELLLLAGVAARAQEPVRRVTALHAVAAQGHLRLAERFVALGVPLDAQDWHGITPLVAAASMGHVPVASLLLRSGAKPDVVPAEAPTALIAAIQAGNVPLVDVLLAAGASPRLPDVFGTTPLQAARRAKRQALVGKLEALQ